MQNKKRPRTTLLRERAGRCPVDLSVEPFWVALFSNADGRSGVGKMKSSAPRRHENSRAWQCADGLARKWGGSGLSPSETSTPCTSAPRPARRVPASRAAEPYPEPRGQFPESGRPVNEEVTVQGSVGWSNWRRNPRGEFRGGGTLPWDRLSSISRLGFALNQGLPRPSLRSHGRG